VELRTEVDRWNTVGPALVFENKLHEAGKVHAKAQRRKEKILKIWATNRSEFFLTANGHK
ncbi:MAG TPA: hypothetical protein VNW23_06190, partial [Opitutaceae bacterium]|nr:hypothetical protein [Opitutaceae bacterium]